MEYSESIIYGNKTEKVTCQRCGANEHKVNGIIKYAYFLLAFISFYPVKKTVQLECTGCLQLTEEDELSQPLIQEFKKSLFSFYVIATKFIGLFLLLAMLGFWYADIRQENQQTELYLVAPKVDDFYFLDYRLMADNLRPNEKYRLAKVVDITGDVISVVYSSAIYSRASLLTSSIKSGQILAGKFFSAKRYDFTLDNLKSLRNDKAILKIKRPIDHWLYGILITKPASSRNTNTVELGPRHNNIGLAFQEATYLKDNFKSAFNEFLLSAEHDYAYGKYNLANSYLSGKYQGKNGKPNVEKALYWFKQASFHPNKSAIEKYTILCRKIDSCDIGKFYQELLDAGVNLQLN
ncbi:MAG: hypothetical protein MJK12_05805 [Colwellia sp.]|nr:hypothetical protein [Colwellia sp.]